MWALPERKVHNSKNYHRCTRFFPSSGSLCNEGKAATVRMKGQRICVGFSATKQTLLVCLEGGLGIPGGILCLLDTFLWGAIVYNGEGQEAPLNLFNPNVSLYLQKTKHVGMLWVGEWVGVAPPQLAVAGAGGCGWVGGWVSWGAGDRRWKWYW